ncbi:MAG TPA: pyrroloquinoline quinone-dependent dehydrogenase, partial [Rhizomicrobium sp.]|nr:pyrroloquinoline quinone-dependent dehydrogenase [Rhizomicrobium sp.]
LPPLDNPYGKQLTAFEATPIKVGDSLYFCQPDNVVTALDAETGKLRWRFNPNYRKWSAFRVCRGVSYHHAAQPGVECADRIIAGTTDARLIALDARTGKLCPGFGNRGTVNLLEGMGHVDPGGYTITSAPTIIGDSVVVGGGVTDNGKANNPSGVIRAFNVITGKLAWAWDMERPTERGLPPPGGEYTRGTPNGWAPFSADPALGLVFVPTGNSNPDNYGAKRTPAAEKYSSSVIALDAATGDVRWSYQTVHHDLWDYDVGSQPVLADFPTAAGPVPAVIQATKRGEVFVLDRRTGRPLTKVVEKPVPQGAAKGDWTAKTQPFSVEMPNFVGEPVSEKSMWGLTPLDQLWCRIQFRKARSEGIFTPPTDGKPYMYTPGWMGGMDWSSVSIDPQRNIMVATTMHIANYNRFVTHEEARRNPAVTKAMTPQDGSPYFGILTDYFHSPLGVPCQQPPYGRLNAIDLKTRKLLWSEPLGTAKHSGPLQIPFLRVPFAIPMGNVTMGGNIVTASGLIFIGASLDQQFRAMDVHSGKELWSAPLEAAGFATPVSYVSPRSGRQFVAIAVGGFSKYGPNNGLYIDAFALPGRQQRKDPGTDDRMEY